MGAGCDFPSMLEGKSQFYQTHAPFGFYTAWFRNPKSLGGTALPKNSLFLLQLNRKFDFPGFSCPQMIEMSAKLFSESRHGNALLSLRFRLVSGYLLSRCYVFLCSLCSARSPTAGPRTHKVSVNASRAAHCTVDEKDLFQANTKILKSFWDPEGTWKPLHQWNYVRLPYIRDRLVEVAPGEKFSTCLKGMKILDAGCGGGVLSEGLAKYGAEVTGIDLSRELVELAQQHCAANRRLADNLPTYIYTSIEEHSSKCAEQYDAVVVSEVLEHVAQKELFVESCARAARPGGKLIFTTPTRTRAAQFYMVFLFENILKAYPKGAHDYNKFLRPSELQFMLEMNDCSVESVRGYIYHPLASYWEWTPRTWFSFAMEAVKAA
ncbi:ubiquinone biosynthesis O-methyltransferase-like [Maniola hyperantus]|uniref:ubiquinone biosynthesis O-methyltransferase-like n=1 Tax=Aphantopus hyperantus TaxID=2795564 RepID=UPI00374887D5